MHTDAEASLSTSACEHTCRLSTQTQIYYLTVLTAGFASNVRLHVHGLSFDPGGRPNVPQTIVTLMTPVAMDR